MDLRWAVERASHHLVLRRRLPPPFTSARIYVSTEGGLRYLARTMAEVDPTLLQLAAQVVRPGDTVWDVGANMGLFSFAAAVAAGPAGPVEVLPVAVSDELSVASFHVARRNRATNHLAGFGSAMAGGVRSRHLVPTVTLDWLAARFPAPNVLKIDVEGAELAVLSGGTAVLACSPTVICEVYEQNADAVTGILAGHGYTLYDGERSGEREPVAAAPFNTLAIVTRGLVRRPDENGRVPHARARPDRAPSGELPPDLGPHGGGRPERGGPGVRRLGLAGQVPVDVVDNEHPARLELGHDEFRRVTTVTTIYKREVKAGVREGERGAGIGALAAVLSGLGLGGQDVLDVAKAAMLQHGSYRLVPARVVLHAGEGGDAHGEPGSRPSRAEFRAVVRWA
jgi:hypothetical protein